MRAVVYDAVGAPPQVREVPEPECPPGGVVVAVAATGVCRSDWHAWRGHDPVALPHVPGHELAGTVLQVGAGVRRFAVGDRVRMPLLNGCGLLAVWLGGGPQVGTRPTQPVEPGCVCARHTCCWPAAHSGQAPHAVTNGVVTRSPGRHERTSAPTATTVPASS